MLLKMSRDCVAQMFNGKEFQSLGADTEKARSPKDVVCFRDSFRRSLFVDRRLRLGGERSSLRYGHAFLL